MNIWRANARRVIVAALAEGRGRGLDGNALEKFVSDAYPFGERAMHPYKIWLNEFSLLVRGEKKPMGRPKAKAKATSLVGEWPMTARQRELFGEEPPR